jgi:hypothetical protein
LEEVVELELEKEQEQEHSITAVGSFSLLAGLFN